MVKCDSRSDDGEEGDPEVDGRDVLRKSERHIAHHDTVEPCENKTGSKG